MCFQKKRENTYILHMLMHFDFVVVCENEIGVCFAKFQRTNTLGATGFVYVFFEFGEMKLLNMFQSSG